MSDLQNLSSSTPPSSPIIGGHSTPIPVTCLRRVYEATRAPILLIAGLYLASFPETFAERAPWSAKLQYLSTFILKADADKPRYFTAFGLELIVLSIHFSPRTREILSNRLFLWLGKNSFAVYLLHGTLLRTFLTYVLYGIQLPTMEVENEDGTFDDVKLTIENPLKMIFWIPVFFVVLYGIANFWTGKVDPLCAEWSRGIELYVFKREEKEIGCSSAEARRLSAGAKRDDALVVSEEEKKMLSTPGGIV